MTKQSKKLTYKTGLPRSARNDERLEIVAYKEEKIKILRESMTLRYFPTLQDVKHKKAFEKFIRNKIFQLERKSYHV